MKISRFFLLFAVLVAFTTITFAQTTSEKDDKLSLYKGSLENQFEYVIQKSNRYQDYKVVKKNWLITLKSHTLDSLNAIKRELNETMDVVKNQNNEVKELQTSLSNTQQKLDETIEEKDSMSFFGAPMSKSGYNSLMLVIIAALFILLVVFIYKFNSSNRLTKNAKEKLNEVETEFEEHRRIALEREQKVRRQLQDEINKNRA